MPGETERLLDEISVLEYRAGDVGGLERLIQRWQPRMHVYLYSVIQDREAVWDVSQEVWLAVVAALNKSGGIRNFAAWIYGIAHNKCVDYFSARRRGEEAADDAPEPAASDDTLQLVLAAENAAAVRECISELPVQQREAVALYYLDGLSVEEAAKVQGAPEATVRTRLFHARRKLKEALARKGYDDVR